MAENKFAAYLCGGCGIAERLDMGRLAAVAQKEGKMALVRTHEFLCSQAGVEAIRADIAHEGVTHVAIAGFVIPYMAVYDPALMLQPTSPGAGLSLVAVVYVIVKAVLAIGLWGGAAIGFLRGPLNWAERVVAFAAAALLVAAVPSTDELGFAASVLFIAWHLLRTRKQPRKAPARERSA